MAGFPPHAASFRRIYARTLQKARGTSPYDPNPETHLPGGLQLCQLAVEGSILRLAAPHCRHPAADALAGVL